MSRAILAVLALVACGPPDFGLIATCPTLSGYAAVKTQAPEPNLCMTVDEAENLSRAILIKSGTFPESILEAARGQRTLGVLEDDTFMVGNDPRSLGGIEYTEEIVVGHDLWSLLHEEIHACRSEQGVPEADEAAHKGWDDPRNGFIALTDFFVFQWLGLRVCNAQSPLTLAQVNGLSSDFDMAEFSSTACVHAP